LRTPFVALPNVLLGRRAFPELLQRDARPRRLALEVARALDGRRQLLEACDEVDAVLGPRRSASREVAGMLLPWLQPPEVVSRQRQPSPE
jgi:lipid-A-disaccharide synthase